MINEFEILSKVVKWAVENEIEIALSSSKEEGYARQIEVKLSRNGKYEVMKFYDFDDLSRPIFKNMITERALNLCLTRLEL